MYYKGNNLQSQVNLLNSEWIIQHRIDNPNDKITQRYAEIIKVFEFEYVLKDSITEQYITDYIEIVDELPEKPIWHEENMNIQLIFRLEKQAEFIIDNPDFAEKIKLAELPVIIENGFVYIYANYILPEDKEKLENPKYEIIINEKQ